MRRTICISKQSTIKPLNQHYPVFSPFTDYGSRVKGFATTLCSFPVAACYLQLAISDFFVHSPFDRHTVADREADIFVDFLIEELAAKRRRTILSTGYYFSDIGSRNRKVAVRSVAGDWAVMFGTFGRIPVSSFPRGYRLWSCSMKRICVNCMSITRFYTCVSCCAIPSELWLQAVLEYNVMSIKIEVSSFGNFWLSENGLKTM